MKTALVTGSNGLVGSHLVEALLQKNYSVRCLVRKTSNKACIQSLPVDFACGELIDKKSLEDAVKDVDYIFHCGAVTKAKDAETFYRINFEGTKNLFEECLKVNPNIKRFIFISSQAASGPAYDKIPLKEDAPCHPISDYGKSKYAAEMYLNQNQNKLPVTIIRPPSVLGPRDKDVYIYFKLLNKKLKPVIGDGNYFINFIYVKDLVNGIIQSAESDKGANQTYFLADDKIYSWDDFAEIVKKTLNVKPFSIKISIGFVYFIISIVEVFSKITKSSNILTKQKIDEFSERYWICSSQKARDDFGFSTQNIEIAIQETINWYKTEGWL